VRVHVDRGTVTLTGPVRWPHQREAEAVVRQVAGVRAVVNHIAAQAVNREGFEAPEPR
jgi:osmotically-inducible protein OsmY